MSSGFSFQQDHCTAIRETNLISISDWFWQMTSVMWWWMNGREIMENYTCTVSSPVFNKLAGHWFGKFTFIRCHRTIIAKTKHPRSHRQLKRSFTCKFHHKAGSCDCHNSHHQHLLLCIQGDHKICHNTGHIHSLDLKQDYIKELQDYNQHSHYIWIN